MARAVEFHGTFADEFRDWRHDVQKAAATSIATLELVGPLLGRPHADSLKGSRHKNMKELRSAWATVSGESHMRSIRAGGQSC